MSASACAKSVRVCVSPRSEYRTPWYFRFVSVPYVHFHWFPFYFGLTRKTGGKKQKIIMVGYILHCHGAFLRFLVCDYFFFCFGFVWERDVGGLADLLDDVCTYAAYMYILYTHGNTFSDSWFYGWYASSDCTQHTTHNYRYTIKRLPTWWHEK